MARNEWKDKRRERLLDFIRGEHADNVRDRWTHADLLWAYNYGFKHGIEKRQFLPKKWTKKSDAYKRGMEAIKRLRLRN